jgi:hypothetical protein
MATRLPAWQCQESVCFSALASGNRQDPCLGVGARVHCLPKGRRAPSALEENIMRDVIFILLTLAIFAVLALIARGVERM